MKCIRVIFSVILILFPIASLRGSPPDGAEEAIYAVRYYGYEATYIVYLHSGSVFIPLFAFINDFKIFNDYDADSHILNGYISNPKNQYKINFKRYEGHYLSKAYYFSSDEFFFDGADAYCSIDLIHKSLGISSIADKEFLTITIKSQIELPILKFKRSSNLSASALDGEEIYFPEYNTRKWKLFDGGMLDWSLNGSFSSGHKSYGAAGALGIQALGGDLVVRNYSSVPPNANKVQSTTTWTWRYFFGDNGWLSQIALGEAIPMGRSFNDIRSNRIVGAQITNESHKIPYLFGRKKIEGTAQPGWVVELYRNARLYDQALTDENGKYTFNPPITYGYNNYELRYYGGRGEYISKSFVYDAPPELLRPGEIRYSASYGDDILYRDRIGEGRLSFGITNWLTNTIYAVSSFDKPAYRNPLIAKPDLMDIVSFTPYPRLFSRFVYNRDKFMSAYIKTYLFSGIFTEVKHTVNDKDYKIGSKYWTEFRTTVPRIANLPVSLLLSANRFSYGSAANSTISLSVNSYINPFFLSVNYFTIGSEYKKDFRIASHNALADVSYNRYGESKFLYGIFSNIRIGMRGGWSSMTPNEPNWGAYINKQFSQNVYLGLSSNSTGLFKNSSLFMQLSMYLPYLNSMTSSNVSGSRQTINQQISGSLGFDTGNLQFVAASQRGGGFAGRGAANVRFFMDNNNNGAYDANDSELTDYEVSLINVNVLLNKSGGIIRLSNLTPYDRINIKVDETSAKNPLVLPLKKEFSFISDPNVYQEIDIPCVMGGVFEGRVIYQFAPDSSKAQPGVRLILRSVDTGLEESLAVFSDGSFYKLGVAPGKYELTLDPTQAKILKARVEPLAITIKKTIEGDYISGLTLTLYPLEKRAPGGADTK